MNNCKVQPFLFVACTILQFSFCPLLTVSCYCKYIQWENDSKFNLKLILPLAIAQSDEPAMMAIAPNVITGNNVAEEEENGRIADELEQANFNLATLAGAYDKKSLTSSNSDLSSDKFLAQSGGYLQHVILKLNLGLNVLIFFILVWKFVELWPHQFYAVYFAKTTAEESCWHADAWKIAVCHSVPYA